MWAMRLRDRSQVRAAWGVKRSSSQASIAKGPGPKVSVRTPGCSAPAVCSPCVPEKQESCATLRSMGSSLGSISQALPQKETVFLGSFVTVNAKEIQKEECVRVKGTLNVKTMLPVVERRRREGPPIAGKRKRGSESAALAIAEDPELLKQAQMNFNELKYDPGSARAKKSKLSLWEKLCAKVAMEPYPLTPKLVDKIGAILRGADYKSGMMYIYEAKQMHDRKNFPTSDELALALKDAERAMKRNTGPDKKSAEVWPEWWDELQDYINEGEVTLDREEGEPAAGLHAWGAGSGAVLREIELSAMTIHGEQVLFDDEEKTVTVKIPASKTDPGGKGASRTFRCSCSEMRKPSCARCSFKALVEHAVSRWDGSNRWDEEAKNVPLVGTVRDNLEFVSKNAMVAALKKDAELVTGWVEHPRIALLDPDDVTGHAMRRSGIKRYVRLGWTTPRCMFVGRWGSAAVMGYIEEAIEESPYLQNPDAPLADFKKELDNIKKLIEGERKKETDTVELENQMVCLAADLTRQMKEVTWMIKPEAVLNKDSKTLHWTDGCVGPLAGWKTACGWSWVLAGHKAIPVNHCADPREKIIMCERCGHSENFKKYTSSLPEKWREALN